MGSRANCSKVWSKQIDAVYGEWCQTCTLSSYPQLFNEHTYKLTSKTSSNEVATCRNKVKTTKKHEGCCQHMLLYYNIALTTSDSLLSSYRTCLDTLRWTIPCVLEGGSHSIRVRWESCDMEWPVFFGHAGRHWLPDATFGLNAAQPNGQTSLAPCIRPCLFLGGGTQNGN